MKKIISICLCISILCGCGNMRGIRRQSTQNLHKLINENNELYYNDKEGHNDKVKMIKRDNTHAQIKIPVRYTEEIGDITQLRKISMTPEELSALNSIGECRNCEINQNYLTINIGYYDTGNTVGTLALGVVLFPFTLLWAWNCLSDNNCDNRSVSLNKIVLNEPPAPIEILEPAGILNLQKRGLILFPSFNIQPKKITVHCNKKYCVVTDENKQIVNEILIQKKIIPNKTEINELIAAQERKDKEEQEHLKSIHKKQDKICPQAYEDLEYSLEGSVERFRAMSIWNKFECRNWLSKEITKEEQRHSTAQPKVTRANQNKICSEVFNKSQYLSSLDILNNMKAKNLWQEYQCWEWQERYMYGEDISY